MRHLITLTICSATFAGTAGAEEFVVAMAGANYSPPAISALVGDTIRFVNDDGADHNVFVPTSSHALDIGKQEPGSESTLTLRTPGSFDVECVFHSHMQLTVEVRS